MSDKKILTIVGATGQQGGGVVDEILNNPTANKLFKVRAITRNKKKPNAKRLEERGCEVVEADLDDKASLEAAFKGSYGVFGVTDFWNMMSADTEIQQGKNIADAARSAGVQHLVFSSLLNVTKASNGKMTGVTHFDSKAKVAEYIKFLGVPASFFMPGFYMTNLPSQCKINDDGSIVWTLPLSEKAQLPVFDTKNDTGKYVIAIFLKGLKDESVFGKEFPAATRYMTPKEIMDEVAEVKGCKASFLEVGYNDWVGALKGMGMPADGAEDLGQNFLLCDASKGGVGYYGGADVVQPQKDLGVKPTELREWLKANEWDGHYP